MISLARLIDVEPRSVSAYEKGEFSPDAEKREQIARNSREFFDRYLHRAQLAAYYLAKALQRLRELP